MKSKTLTKVLERDLLGWKQEERKGFVKDAPNYNNLCQRIVKAIKLTLQALEDASLSIEERRLCLSTAAYLQRVHTFEANNSQERTAEFFFHKNRANCYSKIIARLERKE